MLQTLLISLFSGSLRTSYWFSYSLFLIFIGGILILFIYITSLASNETFKFSINKLITFLLIILLFFLIVIRFNFFDLGIFNINLIKNLDNGSLPSINYFFFNFIELSVIKIFNYPTNLISILLINYLFLTLIARVKITNIFKGPLRPSN